MVKNTPTSERAMKRWLHSGVGAATVSTVESASRGVGGGSMMGSTVMGSTATLDGALVEEGEEEEDPVVGETGVAEDDEHAMASLADASAYVSLDSLDEFR